MKFVFWHHEVAFPLELDRIWSGTQGYAGSVANLRILFWIAARGHEVQLIGHVQEGTVKGVTAIAGDPWMDARLNAQTNDTRPILVILSTPTEVAWRRAVESGIAKRFTVLMWVVNPIRPVWLERAQQGCPARIICVSQCHKNWYRIYRSFDSVEVCYAGGEGDLAEKAPGQRAAEPVALFSSVPRRTKGVHHVLRAWELVRRALPNAKLRIAGSARMHGPEAKIGPSGVFDSDVEREFPAYFANPPESLSSHGIELLGPLTLPELYTEMKRSWVALVNCNLKGSLETYCRSAIEAQAAGVPVIGGAAGSLPEVVAAGKTGILVRRNEPPFLAEAIVEILRNDSLRERMGRAGPEWARKFWDQRLIVRGWEEVAVRAQRGQPAPDGTPDWSRDFLRAVGYGSARAWLRERIRGTRLEENLLARMRN